MCLLNKLTARQKRVGTGERAECRFFFQEMSKIRDTTGSIVTKIPIVMGHKQEIITRKIKREERRKEEKRKEEWTKRV